MPKDANLDSAYFMKNRDRLLKLIKFLKENEEVTDESIKLRSTQENITMKGLELRCSYSVSAMSYLTSFIASFGGVEYFRTTPLEMIAGHRALAVYIIHYLQNEPEIPGKCPYYKCSMAAALKLYKKIYQLTANEIVSEENIRAMQHILQSKNYYNDYFDIKETPINATWSEENFLNRVKEFIQQQITFDNKKIEKVAKNAKVEASVKIANATEDNVTLRQPEDVLDVTPSTSKGEVTDAQAQIGLSHTVNHDQAPAAATTDTEARQLNQYLAAERSGQAPVPTTATTEGTTIARGQRTEQSPVSSRNRALAPATQGNSTSARTEQTREAKRSPATECERSPAVLLQDPTGSAVGCSQGTKALAAKANATGIQARRTTRSPVASRDQSTPTQAAETNATGDRAQRTQSSAALYDRNSAPAADVRNGYGRETEKSPAAVRGQTQAQATEGNVASGQRRRAVQSLAEGRVRGKDERSDEQQQDHAQILRRSTRKIRKPKKLDL